MTKICHINERRNFGIKVKRLLLIGLPFTFLKTIQKQISTGHRSPPFFYSHLYFSNSMLIIEGWVACCHVRVCFEKKAARVPVVVRSLTLERALRDKKRLSADENFCVRIFIVQRDNPPGTERKESDSLAHSRRSLVCLPLFPQINNSGIDKIVSRSLSLSLARTHSLDACKINMQLFSRYFKSARARLHAFCFCAKGSFEQHHQTRVSAFPSSSQTETRTHKLKDWKWANHTPLGADTPAFSIY